MNRRPRILYVMLEYSNWANASRWGYFSNMGMEPGLVANNVECVILPATHRYDGRTTFWIDHARRLLAGQKFDQIWFEVVHSALDDSILEFFTELAPVRLGFAFESLELLPIEWQNNPSASRIREETLQRHLAVTTHLLTVDETDALRLQGAHFDVRPVPPGFVIPSRYLEREIRPPQVQLGLFYGTIYADRGHWLQRPEVAHLLRYVPRSPELETELPAAFDILHAHAGNLLRTGAVDMESLATYVNCNRQIRAACFDLWLAGLEFGAAIVNLPQIGRAYAGRVVEGMAAGRPVITREMENRPLAKAAFEDGKEILLYKTPDQLAEHLTRVIEDQDFARRIALAARAKLKQTHRMESYFADILRWTQGSTTPRAISQATTLSL